MNKIIDYISDKKEGITDSVGGFFYRIRSFFYYGWHMSKQDETFTRWIESVVNIKCKSFLKFAYKPKTVSIDRKFLETVEKLEKISSKLMKWDSYSITKYTPRIKKLRTRWDDYSLDHKIIPYHANRIWRDKETQKVLGDTWITFDPNCPAFKGMMLEAKEYRSLTKKHYEEVNRLENKDHKEFNKLIKDFGGLSWME